MARVKVSITFCFAYFACAEASVFLSAQDARYMSFWLPSGLFVAVLLLNETRAWPWLLLAALPANLAFDLSRGTPFVAGLGFYFSNAMQALTGAWLVRRFIAERPAMTNLKQFAGLIGFCAVLGAALGATIGAATLVAAGLSGSFAESWRVWWGGNALAILLLSPFLLAWFSPSSEEPRRHVTLRYLAEFAVLVSGYVFEFFHIFYSDRGIMSPNRAWLVPLLLWAGLRFGVRGATAINLAITMLLAFITTRFLDGLTPGEIASREYIHVLQNLLAVVPLVGLVPALVLNERDQTLRRLRQSEERFRHLTQAAFEGVCLSENGRIVDINDQGLKMFGYERNEIIGKPIVDLVAPESRTTVAEAIQTGQEVAYEHQLLRKDGSTFYAEAQAKMMPVEDRILRMTALRDITVRKQAGQALRESEEKFSSAFRASPDAIAIVEMETSRLIAVNESFCRLHGYTQEESIGRTSLELGLWASASERELLLLRLREHGRVRDLEFPTRTRTGELRTILLSSEVIELAGKKCVLSVVRDITGRKHAEQRLQQSREQLRALSARVQSLREEERTRLAREIHDHLGQLLTALKLDIRMAERRLNALAAGELRDAVLSKLTAARGLADESISAVQQIASELRPALLDRVGLEAAIESEGRAFQSRTDIQCDFGLPTKPMVLTRDQAITVFRIFQETLTNVARHAKAAHISVRLSQENGALLLEVADDGIGIQPADLEHPQSLGLLGMQERAEMLGGQIRFERNQTKGTAVTLRLPLGGKA